MRSMVYKSIGIVLMIAVGMMIMAAHHENESQKKQEIFDRNVAQKLGYRALQTKIWMHRWILWQMTCSGVHHNTMVMC